MAYPPKVSTEEGRRLTVVIKDWATAHGLAVRPPPAVIPHEADPKGLLATTVPVTLFPSPFPRTCFDGALAIQKPYNLLYASISQDEDFLAQIVEDIGDSDDFIQELWKVHVRVRNEGYAQNLSLGLFRSDYMVHQSRSNERPQIKQVEFNTIAASFGGLSAQTSLLHKYLATVEYPLLDQPLPTDGLSLPDNTSAKGLAIGIRQAFSAYGPPGSGHAKCVVFLVQDGERNIFDQRHLEYEVQGSSPSVIPVFRLAFSQIKLQTRIEEDAGRRLLFTCPDLPKHTFETAVVYMRSGYGPSDYKSASDWDARHHIERSAAIKCPSVLTQIAGTKKVQQILATPQASSAQTSPLLQFTDNADQRSADNIAALERTFTNIFPLDSSPAGIQARAIALDSEQCQNYVLKPQREGGGNNIYRSAIPPFLRSIPEAHWNAYILMELITPPSVTNTILRNGVLEQGGVICELGVYGTCLWDQRKKAGRGVVFNDQVGYLLRTKGDQSEEGGVAAGFGCMDSCALV